MTFSEYAKENVVLQNYVKNIKNKTVMGEIGPLVSRDLIHHAITIAKQEFDRLYPPSMPSTPAPQVKEASMGFTLGL